MFTEPTLGVYWQLDDPPEPLPPPAPPYPQHSLTSDLEKCGSPFCRTLYNAYCHVTTPNNKTGNARINRTLRRARATLVAVEKQEVLHTLCVYRPSYPAGNAPAPYCHLWPVPLYYIFARYLINGKIFERKKLLNTKSVSWFPLQLLSEPFLILRRTEGDMIKMYTGLHVKQPL